MTVSTGKDLPKFSLPLFPVRCENSEPVRIFRERVIPSLALNYIMYNNDFYGVARKIPA